MIDTTPSLMALLVVVILLLIIVFPRRHKGGVNIKPPSYTPKPNVKPAPQRLTKIEIKFNKRIHRENNK
jgi:hypothetical protein